MFTEKIKDLRQSRGLNKRQMAEMLELPYTTYNNYEIGAREANSDVLKKISKVFGVSVDFLIDNSDFVYGNINLIPPQITDDVVTFPVMGDVAAGFDKIAIEDWTGDEIDVPSQYLKGRNKDDFFVLKIKGDSMYPEYRDGDKVLVLKQNFIDYSGQVAVAIYGDNIGTVKKVEYKKDYINLVPINPQYRPEEIKDTDSLHILGIPKLLVREIEE